MSLEKANTTKVTFLVKSMICTYSKTVVSKKWFIGVIFAKYFEKKKIKTLSFELSRK